MSSNNRQNVWETVPQKGFFGIQKACLRYFLQSFGNGSLIMV